MRLAGKQPIIIIVAVCGLFLASCSVASAEEGASPDAPHNEFSDVSVGCLTCHDMSAYDQLNLIPDAGHIQTDDDHTLYNDLCWGCHDGVHAPSVQTHSSLQTSSRYGDWTVECWVCHNQHAQAQLKTYGLISYIYTNTSTAITSTTITRIGASWAVDEFAGMIVVPDIAKSYVNYVIESNTSDTLNVKGIIDLTMVSAGDTFGINYGQFIRNLIDLNNITNPSVPKSGRKQVKFFTASGANSFADGDSVYNGICEVCHTLTSHFRNDGGGSDPLHTNMGEVAGTDCMECHDHRNGFAHGGSSGTGCIDCHGHDAGTYFDPDMLSPYLPGTVVSPGAGTFQSHSTHTETDADDRKGPGLYCGDCHDINNFPAFNDGKDLTNTTICDNCHSKSGSYDGIDDPVIGAKAIWRTGAYAATDDSTLRSGKEKWCAGCHDESSSVIGVAAPNVIGDEDGSYIYGTGWGYYKTGHGLAADDTYPSKGGIETLSGRPVECDSCHDFSTLHIDSDARSFDCSDGCDPVEYRQSYRLKLVGGEEPMEIPWIGAGGSAGAKFRICVQMGCHAPESYTDPASTETNFFTWTTREEPPGSGIWVNYWENRHEYHLTFENQNRYPADYNYGGTYNSRITCVTCHNVHGSTQLAMVRDGKLISREPGLKIWYDNPEIVTYQSINPDPPVPENVPLSASTGTIWRGATSANLCTHCHGNDNTLSECRDSSDPACSSFDPPFQVDAQQAPTLDWTGETGFVVDGANPDSGSSGSSYTFRVKYTDTNNDSPSPIEVWIDLDNNGYAPDEKHTMIAVDDGDITYFDGKLYTFSTTLTNTGGDTKVYRFVASDGMVPATGAPTADGSVYIFSSSQGSGSAPVLDWTGEAGYSVDGVRPDSGQNNDSFEFRVKYSDADNDPPALIEVWIDGDLNNAYSVDEKITLDKVGSGTDYAGGEIYSSGSIPLSCGDGCSLDYRFYATDGNEDAVVNEPVFNHEVLLENNVPVLSWTGEADYVNDGVDPESAAGGDSFFFRIDYTDADNTAPAVIQVWVDMDDSDTYDNDEKITMDADDSLDLDYTNGKRYAKAVQVPYVGDGLIRYRFHGQDAADLATGDPTVDRTIETTPPVGNNPPSLAWTNAFCLSDGVRPSLGAVGADFEFMVEYTDADNICPTGTGDIQVWVDSNDNGSYDSEEKFDLAEADALDVNCVDGKLYRLTMALPLAGDGVLPYRFYATDGMEVATGPPVAGSTVAVAVATRVRPAGSSLPYDYTSIIAAANAVTGTILVYPNDDFTPVAYAEQIWLNNRDNLNIVSTCGPDFTTISSNSGDVITAQDSANLVVDGFSITSGNSGNGIYVNRVDSTVITFRNDKIYNNIHGIFINDSDAQFVKVDHCEIYGNSARGITLISSDDWVDVENSEIHSHNVAAGGAALSMGNGGQARISKSIVRDNATTVEGGAFYVNGAATFIITNSLVIRNAAGTNGGVIRTNNGPTVSFINTTVADNQGANGGVFYICTVGMTIIRNCILWENFSTSGSGSNVYKVCGGGNIGIIEYSDIDTTSPAGIYNATFTDGSGNINQDPSFDPDYRLQALSPAIDTGRNDGNTTVPSDDIDNEPRGYDGDGAGMGGTGDGSDYDMGADEYQP